MSRTFRMATASVGVAASALLLLPEASATEGYFQNGYGARHKGLAGAGAADVSDATGLAVNPAGLTRAEHGLQVSVSLFAPDRGFTGSGGAGFTPVGSFNGNESDVFVIPNFAYSRAVGQNGAFGITAYGNGGLNTDYAAIANPACAQPSLPAPNGVFCGGETGVNLNQLFVSAGYAHDFGNFSLGAAPILAIQTFAAKGLAAFAGASADPTRLTNNGTNTATGVGVRFGVDWDISDRVRFGASYQSEIDMSEFDDYAGLFEGGGDFDVPQSFQAGLAFDATDRLTLLADYRWIEASATGAVGNPTNLPVPFGADGGAGFGWDDVEAVKFAAEWQADPDWTLRGGVAFNSNPVGSEDVTLNILAPGVVTQHYTAGFERRFGEASSFEFAFVYAPEETVRGIEFTPQGANPGRTIELRMEQVELTVGYTYRFGG